MLSQQRLFENSKFLLTAFGLLFSLSACAQTMVAPVETKSLAAQIIRGASISLEIVEQSKLGSEQEFSVVQQPVNGVVRQGANVGTLMYQHGGTSPTGDRFTVVWRESTGVRYSKEVTLEFRDRVASVLILAPRNGAVLPAGPVDVRYQTQGRDFNHLHISIDNKGHNTIRELTGSYILENVLPGEHVVRASLVDKNHNAIGGADAIALVKITVEP